jgi:hypothetical protein
MSVTYEDFVNAMVVASKNGKSTEKIVVTEDTMETFIADSKMTDAEQEAAEGELGSWSIPLETGNSNHVLTESGEKIFV